MKRKFLFILTMLLLMPFTIVVNAKNYKEKDVRIVEFDDGGKDYIFTINGAEEHCLVPPEDFNPIDATNEELERYCFPPRPNNENELNDWIRMMDNYKGTPIPEVTTIEVSKRKTRALSYVSNYASTTIYAYADFRAGYSAITHGTTEISQVQMNYAQPTILSTSDNCKNLYGIGIGNDYREVSIGTGSNGMNNNFVWIRCVSDNPSIPLEEIEITSLIVNPGDSIHLYISYEKENNKVTYYIANNTTGQSTNGYLIRNAADYYSGISAQWFVERGVDDGKLLNLGKFGTFTPSLCQYKFLNTSGWNNISNASTIEIIKMRNQSTLSEICTPSSIFGGSCFTCTWQAYN